MSDSEQVGTLGFRRDSASRLCETLMEMYKEWRERDSQAKPSDNVDSASVWKERGETFLGAVLTPLAWLREHEGWVLSPTLLRDALTFNGMLGLVCIKSIPRKHREELTQLLEQLPAMDARFSRAGQPHNSGVSADRWNRALEAAERAALKHRDPSYAGRVFQERSGWKASDQKKKLAVYSGMQFNPMLLGLADMHVQTQRTFKARPVLLVSAWIIGCVAVVGAIGARWQVVVVDMAHVLRLPLIEWLTGFFVGGILCLSLGAIYLDWEDRKAAFRRYLEGQEDFFIKGYAHVFIKGYDRTWARLSNSSFDRTVLMFFILPLAFVAGSVIGLAADALVQFLQVQTPSPVAPPLPKGMEWA